MTAAVVSSLSTFWAIVAIAAGVAWIGIVEAIARRDAEVGVPIG